MTINSPLHESFENLNSIILGFNFIDVMAWKDLIWRSCFVLFSEKQLRMDYSYIQTYRMAIVVQNLIPLMRLQWVYPPNLYRDNRAQSLANALRVVSLPHLCTALPLVSTPIIMTTVVMLYWFIRCRWQSHVHNQFGVKKLECLEQGMFGTRVSSPKFWHSTCSVSITKSLEIEIEN